MSGPLEGEGEGEVGEGEVGGEGRGEVGGGGVERSKQNRGTGRLAGLCK